MGIGTLTETAALISENGIAINSYMNGYMTAKGVRFDIESGYPYDGKIKITLDGEGEFELALRIPAWSKKTNLKVNGEAVTPETGYTRISRKWSKGDLIELELDDSVYAVLPPEDSEYKENYIALRKGAIVLALDKRISDPREKVVLDSENALEYCVLPCELPYYNLSLGVKQKDGSLLHVVDYASAGSTFDDESECAAWLER